MSIMNYANLHIGILLKNKLISKCITSCVNMNLPQKNPSRTLMSVLLFFLAPVKWFKPLRIINSHLSTLQFYATQRINCSTGYFKKGSIVISTKDKETHLCIYIHIYIYIYIYIVL